MRSASFSREAEDDLADAVTWYEEQEPGLGIALVANVEAATGLATAHPGMGMEVEPGLRRIVVKRFPYCVYYLHDNASIRVIAVLHQRQDREARLRRR